MYRHVEYETHYEVWHLKASWCGFGHGNVSGFVVKIKCYLDIVTDGLKKNIMNQFC